MPIIRTPGLPQQNLATGVYGALPMEGMPTPSEDTDASIFYWRKVGPTGGGQWVQAKLRAGAGVALNFDDATGELTISLTGTETQVHGILAAAAALRALDITTNLTASAFLILSTTEVVVDAYAVLMRTEEITFSAAAELV